MRAVTFVGLAAAVLAAALHVLIFWMESIAWEGPLARKTFGGTPAEARPHAFYAYNQGFYNLFLALEALLGVLLRAAGGPGPASWAGTALALFARPPRRRPQAGIFGRDRGRLPGPGGPPGLRAGAVPADLPGPQAQGRPTSLPVCAPAAMSRCAVTISSSG